MKLSDFDKHYPTEKSCIIRFKEMCIQSGVVCPHCGHREHLWLPDSMHFECKSCHHLQSLRSGTIMHSSKLPFLYWFKAIHLMTSPKKTFSALEIQRRLGHKRYQSIREICHKIRSVIGLRDSEYTLSGMIEVDEDFFSTGRDDHDNTPLKRGRDSQKKSKVPVMIESHEVDNPKNTEKPKSVNHLKMIVIPDLKAQTINSVAQNSIEQEAVIDTDASTSYTAFANYFAQHNASVIPPQEISKALPWVHIAISNAKTLLSDMHHGVKLEFLQSYPNEFCYKMNRIRIQPNPFDRLLVVTTNINPTSIIYSIDRSKI
ncbi:IS1595 family transposase [Seramator thermalis]|uniref:IS1595 family transposase n=1 Tax=Seramator thermalis TaxID=2496270 RepID=UPI00101E0A7F|nr:IS1595 family transposase [Seramator thermalis]